MTRGRPANLVINLKTAKALGLPEAFLLRAERLSTSPADVRYWGKSGQRQNRLPSETPKPTQIHIKGASKQLVGQFAANVRKIRPPEPYKGKGIRYEGEQIQRKAGKAVGGKA